MLFVANVTDAIIIDISFREFVTKNILGKNFKVENSHTFICRNVNVQI